MNGKTYIVCDVYYKNHKDGDSKRSFFYGFIGEDRAKEVETSLHKLLPKEILSLRMNSEQVMNMNINCPYCGLCDRSCDNCAYCGTDVPEKP